MSEIFIYDYAFNKKDIINTDVKIKNYDCITPQLTTFEIPKNKNIVDSDIVIIKDENKEFIGIIDSVGGVNTTEISVYPIEHKFDNDLDIDNLNGSIGVVEYLKTQITRNFIDTDDIYMKFPFVFENTLEEDVTYKTIVDGSNLLDIVNDIYLNTGIYMDYDTVYENGKLSAIKVIFKNVSHETIKKIKYNNPQIIDNINYEMCNTSVNKVTIWVGADKENNIKGTPYKIYLREDNQLTTNPKDEYRIKKVNNKNIEFTADSEVKTDDEYAEAIIVTAQKELRPDIFGYKIEFTMLINKNSKWNYRQACVFIAEDRTFYTLVTRIEYLSEKHMKITLGAYRTKLHEKILKIMKPKETAGSSLGGITVTNGFGKYLYWFEKDSDGNLYVCSDNLTETELSAMFELDESKNLYVNYGDTQREYLSIDTDGNLVGGY